MNSDVARDDAFSAGDLLTLARGALFTLPFVFPFAAGPLTNVWQLLAAWSSVAVLLLLGPIAAPRREVLAWMTLVAMSIAVARPHASDFGVSACLAILATGAMAYVGAAMADGDPALWRAPALGLLIAGLLNAVLGLLQYYEMTATLVPWTSAPEAGQAYGNLRQRNQFATLLSMALVAAIWLYAESAARARAMLGGAAVLLVVAMAASTSRTGLLELVVVIGVAAFIALHERRLVGGRGTAAPGARMLHMPPPLTLFALFGVYFVASWLLPWMAATGVDNMLHRLREGAPDAHSRLVLWRNILELIAQHPWTGWGWGELKFAHYSTLYDGPRFAEILDNAHNLPLHLAVELGVPAAVLICGGFCWLVLAARPWRETDATRLMAWGILGVIVLHSLLEYPLWYGPFQLVFGLCLGFLWPAPPSVASRPRPRGLAAPALSKAAAAVLLAIVGYAAWDYTRISQLYLARDERLPAYRDDTQAKVRNSWLFAGPVQFAELTLTPVSTANAAEVHALARRVLHFSPEPRVIVKLIESATLLGLHDEALAQATRFRIAFPREYERWLEGQPIDDPSE